MCLSGECTNGHVWAIDTYSGPGKKTQFKRIGSMGRKTIVRRESKRGRCENELCNTEIESLPTSSLRVLPINIFSQLLCCAVNKCFPGILLSFLRRVFSSMLAESAAIASEATEISLPFVLSTGTVAQRHGCDSENRRNSSRSVLAQVLLGG